MPNSRFLKVGVGLIGVAAMAAVVTPRSAWEALMMEVSSDHFVSWKRDAGGNIVATGNQAPDQSYKPVISNPQSLVPRDSAPSLPVGVAQSGVNSEIAGDWDITFDDPGNYERVRVAAHILPDGAVSYHCVSVTKYGDGIRLNNGSEKGDCSIRNYSAVDPILPNSNLKFAMILGPPPGKGQCENEPFEPFRKLDTYAPDRYRPIKFAAVGPGRYEDHQEHSVSCIPSWDQRYMQTILVQVVGNSLRGTMTDGPVPGHCKDECGTYTTPISGSRTLQIPR